MVLRLYILLLAIVCTLTASANDILKVNAEPSKILSSHRIEVISRVFNKIESIDFEYGKLSPEFKKFYGKDKNALVSYLNDRIKFIVDESEPFSHRGMFQPVAINLGIALWISALNAGKQANYVVLNDKNIEIKSARSGIIQLNGFFYNSETMFQISTLLHEARHSDCPNGIKTKPNGEYDFKDCGYPHNSGGGVEIDKDRFAWGAYAASYLFGEAISNACSNCTDDEKMMGLIIQSDAQNHIIPFAGSPDMSGGE
jgi:hypothetical protein